MWNYIFYIAYLRDKEVTEYGGIESYVSDKIKNQDHSWFPIYKALSLQNQVVDTHLQESQKIVMIEDEMSKVHKNINEILMTVSDIQKKTI
jgi:inositol 1,4,5-triphosphate receptor type 1/inositol 1,4,5-triphosphate receptor type 3